MGNPTWNGEAMNKEVPMLRYQVDDMSCGHCVQAITEAVKGVDANAEVKVDLAAKSVEVTTHAASEAVAGAIRDAGYTPAEAASSAAAATRSCCGHC
jgi:copper chaperone